MSVITNYLFGPDVLTEQEFINELLVHLKEVMDNYIGCPADEIKPALFSRTFLVVEEFMRNKRIPYWRVQPHELFSFVKEHTSFLYDVTTLGILIDINSLAHEFYSGIQVHRIGQDYVPPTVHITNYGNESPFYKPHRPKRLTRRAPPKTFEELKKENEEQIQKELERLRNEAKTLIKKEAVKLLKQELESGLAEEILKEAEEEVSKDIKEKKELEEIGHARVIDTD